MNCEWCGATYNSRQTSVCPQCNRTRDEQARDMRAFQQRVSSANRTFDKTAIDDTFETRFK